MSPDSSKVDGGPKLSHYGELRLHEGVKVAKHEEVLKDMFSETNPHVRGPAFTLNKWPILILILNLGIVIRELSIW